MNLTMYGIPTCGTCKNARKWLEARGHQVAFTDLKLTAPDEETLADLIERSGLRSDKFFNTSGDVYREMNLKDKLKTLSEDEKISLLSANGMLIKRPVVAAAGKGKVTVGFKEEQYEADWP